MADRRQSGTRLDAEAAAPRARIRRLSAGGVRDYRRRLRTRPPDEHHPPRPRRPDCSWPAHQIQAGQRESRPVAGDRLGPRALAGDRTRKVIHYAEREIRRRKHPCDFSGTPSQARAMSTDRRAHSTVRRACAYDARPVWVATRLRNGGRLAWRAAPPSGAADYEARPASSNSSMASLLFSATAARALRVSCSTSARACANSSASPSHHSANDAIASSACSGCAWTSSARYSANDATTQACSLFCRASSRCMASGQLEPAGVCVDILRPLRRNPLRLPEIDAEKTAGRETRHGESAAWRAIWNQTTWRFFLEIDFPQIGLTLSHGRCFWNAGTPRASGGGPECLRGQGSRHSRSGPGDDTVMARGADQDRWPAVRSPGPKAVGFSTGSQQAGHWVDHRGGGGQRWARSR